MEKKSSMENLTNKQAAVGLTIILILILLADNF